MNAKVDKAKGQIKQAVGSLTGDDKLKREGRRDEAAGKVKEKVEDTIDLLRDKVDDVAEAMTRDEQEK